MYLSQVALTVEVAPGPDHPTRNHNLNQWGVEKIFDPVSVRDLLVVRSWPDRVE